MEETNINISNRPVLMHTLAVVGFVALIGASMWLAVYSTRYVPGVVNRIGSAAVYLGSVFTPAPEPTLSVVSTPIASTTISFGGASSTTSTTATTPTQSKQAPTAGPKTTTTVQVSGTSTTVAPYGLPDLAITVSAIGYLETTSTDSFVASSTVPSGSRPAVKFSVKNIGTNWTGTWRFNASIPTRTSYTYESTNQQSLASGDSIDYILGFDRASSGSNQQVTITANFDHVVNETNTNNDSISVYLNIL